MNRLTLIALSHRRVMAGEHVGPRPVQAVTVKPLPAIVRARTILVDKRAEPRIIRPS